MMQFLPLWILDRLNCSSRAQAAKRQEEWTMEQLTRGFLFPPTSLKFPWWLQWPLKREIIARLFARPRMGITTWSAPLAISQTSRCNKSFVVILQQDRPPACHQCFRPIWRFAEAV